MANLTAVDYHTHKHLMINPSAAELHGAELNMIPVVVEEFNNLAVQYPIVLTKHGETGEFLFTALLGFEPHENLFWQDGQWQGVYLPLQIRRQPFFVGNANNGSDELVVCIDTNSPMVTDTQKASSDTEYQTLFDELGNESAYFKNTKQCLSHLIQGEIDNKTLLTALESLDLLQPLSVEITFINEQSTRLNGLYTINQEKLNAVSKEQVCQLHEQKLLQPIYTMVASIGQIYALIERKNTRL